MRRASLQAGRSGRTQTHKGQCGLKGTSGTCGAGDVEGSVHGQSAGLLRALVKGQTGARWGPLREPRGHASSPRTTLFLTPGEEIWGLAS